MSDDLSDPFVASPSGRRRRVHAAAAVLLLAIVGLAVWLGQRERDAAPEAKPAVAAVQVSGSQLPAWDGNGSDPALGAKAPGLAGRDFAGTPVTLTPGDGRAKLVVFAAHWCPHCQRELPRLVRWLADGRLPAETDILLVSTLTASDRPNYPPNVWLEQGGWTQPVLADSAGNTAAQAYTLSGTPLFVFIRKDGTVSARIAGELTPATLDAQAGKALLADA